MPSPPPDVLPPVIQLPLIYETYEDCQVRYLFARELTRNQEIGWYDAYQEAGLVVDAINKSETPLAIGARPGEIVWWVMICAASAYGHMPSQDRALIRSNIADGRPIWAVLAVLTEPDMCDPAALDDPEYRPFPPCVPKEPMRAVTAGLAAAFWVVGLWTSVRAVQEVEQTRWDQAQADYYESIERQQ